MEKKFIDDCIFCKIILGKSPAKIVIEDDFFIAIEDIFPQAPVHLLVIPKTHLLNLNEISSLDSEFAYGLMSGIEKTAKEATLTDGGYRVIVNNGKNAGQLVEHLHFHLVGGKKLGPKMLRDNG